MADDPRVPASVSAPDPWEQVKHVSYAPGYPVYKAEAVDQARQADAARHAQALREKEAQIAELKAATAFDAEAWRQHRDELAQLRAAHAQVQADNERLQAEHVKMANLAAQAREIVGELVDRFGPWHDEDCPADDTCDCSAKPLHDRINAALRDK